VRGIARCELCTNFTPRLPEAPKVTPPGRIRLGSRLLSADTYNGYGARTDTAQGIAGSNFARTCSRPPGERKPLCGFEHVFNNPFFFELHTHPSQAQDAGAFSGARIGAHMKAWMLTCRTLWHCEISGSRSAALQESGFRARPCTDRYPCGKPQSQPRHWTRRVLHQPLVACRT
jgi:hypothetical protein